MVDAGVSQTRPAWTRGGTALVVGVVLFAAVLTLMAFRVTRDGALPGIRVAGLDVGGMARPELATAIRGMAMERGRHRIESRRQPLRISSEVQDTGYLLDVDGTVERALGRGRQLNPLAALRDHLVASVATLGVDPVESFDPGTFGQWAVDTGTGLNLPPIQADLQFDDGQVMVTLPSSGETIDAAALQSALLQAIRSGLTVVEVPTLTTSPQASAAELAALATNAERATSAPVTLNRGTVTLTLTGDEIASLLRARALPVTGDGNTSALELVIDEEALGERMGEQRIAELRTPAADATFAVSGERISLQPATPGYEFSARILAEQLLMTATSVGPRVAQMNGRTVLPELSTDAARDLGIIQRVATFTTEHPCCQGRVRNIHLVADLVQGAIVLPGESFSLNGYTGRRTAAEGFVDGGAINSGEIVEEIGGGISQFATTLFNAAFFGGYELMEYKAHSFYISRYPEGREATLNFDPPIDLAFRNDSTHGIYIDTSYTDTSITVSLFSTMFAEVSSTTSDRRGIREPGVLRRPTSDLPAGQERVIQTGGIGFTVDVTRDLAYVDGRTDRQVLTTTYLPAARITEVGEGGAPGRPLGGTEPPQEPGEQEDQDGLPNPATTQRPQPASPPGPATGSGSPQQTRPPEPDPPPDPGPGPVSTDPDPADPDPADPDPADPDPADPDPADPGPPGPAEPGPAPTPASANNE